MFSMNMGMGVVGRGVTPLSVPGCALWLDGADSAAVTHVAGEVSQWSDKSGNGYHVIQGSASNQPDWGNVTQNGKSVLYFDNGDFLRNTTASGLFSITNGPGTYFVVGKADNASGVNDYLYQFSESAVGRAYILYGSTAGSLLFLNRTSNASAVTNTGSTHNTWQIMRGRRSGTTQAIAINGGTEATNTSALDEDGCDALTIGADGSGANILAGAIAEMIFYNRSLSAQEILQIERYLSSKWGVALL